MQTIPLNEGRRLFGHDPKVYAAARPEYPDVLFDRLKTRCGLRPGSSLLRNWSGDRVGHPAATYLGVSRLRAIEPDPRLVNVSPRRLSEPLASKSIKRRLKRRLSRKQFLI